MKPGTFAHIERHLRELGSPKATGNAFELLCRSFLLNAPQYKGLFAHVWLWREWPGQWGVDKGIDLVAETADGKCWAIQAKAVHPDRTIAKRELDSFLSESNRPEFDYRLIIATTDDIGRNAMHTIDGQEKPVGLVLRGDLLRTALQWPTQIGGEPRPATKKKPHPYQAVAIRDVKRELRHYDRGQLIMACGTGKTLVALWTAERLEARRVLVLVPSLSLISQTLRQWTSNCRTPFDYLVVCSDETVARPGEDHAVTSTRELGIPVTTDADEIRQFLSRKRQARSAVVLCTYQESAGINRLGVANERHRTSKD